MLGYVYYLCTDVNMLGSRYYYYYYIIIIILLNYYYYYIIIIIILLLLSVLSPVSSMTYKMYACRFLAWYSVLIGLDKERLAQYEQYVTE